MGQTVSPSTPARVLYLPVQQADGSVVQVAMQVVSVAVDADGNWLDQDDTINNYEWKRQMLDELRAIRVGIQMLMDVSRKDPFSGKDFDLINIAQALREEQEDQTQGRADAGT
jgi:hypothetical protein